MSNVFYEQALHFVERSGQHVTVAALASDFSQTIKHFGFNYFMMTRLPALGEDAEPYIIVHTWPQMWLERYRSQAYFWHDPVSAFSFTQLRPFSWQEARAAQPRTKKALQLASEARGLGLRDGIGFPMSDPSNAQAVVPLAADQMVDLRPIDRGLLQLICHEAELRAVEIVEGAKAKAPSLTTREREILRWTANGKSQWETSVILNVAEDTVRVHIKNARDKLGATNTPNAVARALRTRQIVL